MVYNGFNGIMGNQGLTPERRTEKKCAVNGPGKATVTNV